MTQVLLFATDNQNKVKELQEAFKQAGLDIELKSNADLDNPPYVNEKGTTFEANAKLKAHALADYSKLLTLADDSGLRVAKLNGAPGVHSARYGGEAITMLETMLSFWQPWAGFRKTSAKPSLSLPLF